MEILASKLDTAQQAGAAKRLERLKHWLERGDKMLPWILRFLMK
jgi:hypothetical protein